jgi:citrate lyase subunit beta/citryl-CoA lyase
MQMRSIQIRSILVFPATQNALEAALTSEADALALDLSSGAEGKVEGKPAALIAEARKSGKLCLAQIHPLPSGRTDADLDAVMPARPDAIILPDARGGRDIQHLGAKLAVREAENDFADGATKILALAGDSPAALFELGSFVRAGRRLIGVGRDERLLAQRLAVAWGDGVKPECLRVARSLCVFAAAAAGAPAYDCAEPGEGADFERVCTEAARDGFAGKMVLSAAQARIVNAVFIGGRS